MLGRRLRELRRERGLTQVELAERAGVSRQLVGAVEAGRHLPRVDAAVAMARVLETAVESLLRSGRVQVTGVVDDPRDGQPVRVGRVGEQLVCVAAMPSGESWCPAHAVVTDGEVELLDAERPSAVVAGCDPAIGLVSRLVETNGGPDIVVAATSTAMAVDALGAGRCHVAVVHGPAGSLPDPPVPARRWRLARWQVGLAAPAGFPAGWPAAALAGQVAVIQREAGAGSQAAFERAADARGNDMLPAGPRAAGHLEAASWASHAGAVAVSIEPAALALGLAFHPLEEHVCELWVGTDHLDVAGVRRFLDEVTGAGLARRLAVIGGYDLTDRGSEVAA